MFSGRNVDYLFPVTWKTMYSKKMKTDQNNYSARKNFWNEMHRLYFLPKYASNQKSQLTLIRFVRSILMHVTTQSHNIQQGFD